MKPKDQFLNSSKKEMPKFSKAAKELFIMYSQFDPIRKQPSNFLKESVPLISENEAIMNDLRLHDFIDHIIVGLALTFDGDDTGVFDMLEKPSEGFKFEINEFLYHIERDSENYKDLFYTSNYSNIKEKWDSYWLSLYDNKPKILKINRRIIRNMTEEEIIHFLETSKTFDMEFRVKMNSLQQVCNLLEEEITIIQQEIDYPSQSNTAKDFLTENDAKSNDLELQKSLSKNIIKLQDVEKEISDLNTSAMDYDEYLVLQFCIPAYDRSSQEKNFHFQHYQIMYKWLDRIMDDFEKFDSFPTPDKACQDEIALLNQNFKSNPMQFSLSSNQDELRQNQKIYKELVDSVYNKFEKIFKTYVNNDTDKQLFYDYILRLSKDKGYNSTPENGINHETWMNIITASTAFKAKESNDN